MLRYKDYVATADYDTKKKIYYGSVIGLKNTSITFKAKTELKLFMAFVDAMDEYFERCSAAGKSPELPNIICQRLVLPKDLYEKICAVAHLKGIDPKQYIIDLLSSFEVPSEQH